MDERSSIQIVLFISGLICIVYSFDPSCNKVLKEKEGWILSPNWSNRYPNNIDCRWNIQAEQYERIILHSREFILDGRRHSICQDYLAVFDTSISPVDPRLFVGCDRELAKKSYIRSRTNEIIITFHSHARSGAPLNAKFALSYKVIGCPSIAAELPGSTELVSLEIDNTTGIAVSAILSCAEGFNFTNRAYRIREYQSLSCNTTSWNDTVQKCIDMSATPQYDTPTAEPEYSTPNTTTPDSMPENAGGASPGVVAGVIFGLLAAIILAVLLVFLWRKYRKPKGTPRRPPVHNEQVYGPTTQPIQTVSEKSRFGLFGQKSKEKYNKDDHHDHHQAKNLLRDGGISGQDTNMASMPGGHNDNSRTALTAHDDATERSSLHPNEDVVYYEPDEVRFAPNGSSADVMTVENKDYKGP